MKFFRHVHSAALASLIAISMTGCAGSSADAEAFLKYFDATAPEYSAYVNTDARLDTDQRTRRLSAVKAAGDYASTIRTSATGRTK